MPYLADTNVVARRVLPTDPQHSVVRFATDRLILAGEIIHVAPQNLIEFRALATRPVAANGLGLSSEEADIRTEMIEAIFSVLPETAEIYVLWRELASKYGVLGRQVFDARLVAVMLTCGITHFLTLDVRDFRRFVPEGITVVEPHELKGELPADTGDMPHDW